METLRQPNPSHGPDKCSHEGDVMEYIELAGGACDDCAIAIANDDYSGMDDATESQVRAGIARIGPHLIIGDEQGFRWEPCGVCGGLAGNRHAVGYLRSTNVEIRATGVERAQAGGSTPREVTAEEVEISDFIRADSREHAKEIILHKYPSATFKR